MILRIICTTNTVTYKTLMEKIDRDRATIVQSVESLIKHGYIEKQKVNPEYEKSKLIFKPTFLGKHHAWRLLNISLEEIMKVDKDEQISNYLEFIKDVSDLSQRERLLQPLSILLTSYISWKSKGNISVEEKKEILKDGFKKGLLELVQNKDYNAKSLLNNRSIK